MYKYVIDPSRLMQAVEIGRRIKYQRFYAAEEETVATFSLNRTEEPEVYDARTMGPLQLTYN